MVLWLEKLWANGQDFHNNPPFTANTVNCRGIWTNKMWSYWRLPRNSKEFKVYLFLHRNLYSSMVSELRALILVSMITWDSFQVLLIKTHCDVVIILIFFYFYAMTRDLFSCSFYSSWRHIQLETLIKQSNSCTTLTSFEAFVAFSIILCVYIHVMLII
jgi:hypothetical protein